MPVHQRRKIYGSVFSLALAVVLILFFLPAIVYILFDGDIAINLGISAVYALALLVPSAIGFTVYQKDMPHLEKKRLMYPPAAFFIALGAITVAAYINYFVILPFSLSGIFVNTKNTETITGIPDIILMVLRSVIIAPICEEIFFRGFVFRRLSPLGTRRAMLVSSIVFSLFHSNVAQFIYTFIAGLALSFIVAITGKMRYSIMIHMINNSISVAATVLTYYYGAEAAGVAFSRMDFLLVFAAIISVSFIFIAKMKDPSIYSIKQDDAREDHCWAISVSSILFVMFVAASTALNNLAIFYN